MAPLIKSAARTRVRTRIRDTVTTYEYSDATVDTYLAAALQEVATHVREVDPDYYLKNVNVKGYTDALDPKASGEQGYEFYPLPPGMASLRWIERLGVSNGNVQGRLLQVSVTDQEGYRYAYGQVFRASQVVDGSTTANLSPVTGRETFSVHGDRFRVLPPPTASGTHLWRIWFDWALDSPEGESEPLDLPVLFEEAFIRAWGQKVVEDDDPELAAANEKVKASELALAKASHRKRTRRNMTLGQVF